MATKILTFSSGENDDKSSPVEDTFVICDDRFVMYRFKFPMLITWVTTVSSSGRYDNVVIKISHGIVVKMTTKIFTV